MQKESEKKCGGNVVVCWVKARRRMFWTSCINVHWEDIAEPGSSRSFDRANNYVDEEN